ncbi:hypothetical protein T484DRAFT_1777243, partial [Baffinella frigidus]
FAKKATVVFVGLVAILSQNGYVDIHWDKAQTDLLGGQKAYKHVKLHKDSALRRLPPDVQEKTCQGLGMAQTAVQHNLGGILLGVVSFLCGLDIGRKAKDM